ASPRPARAPARLGARRPARRGRGPTARRSQVAPEPATSERVDDEPHVLRTVLPADEHGVRRIDHDEIVDPEPRDETARAVDEAAATVDGEPAPAHDVAPVAAGPETRDRGPATDVAPAEACAHDRDALGALEDAVVDRDGREAPVRRGEPRAGDPGQPLDESREVGPQGGEDHVDAPGEDPRVPEHVALAEERF